MFKSAAKVRLADIFILWAAAARETSVTGRPGKPDDRLWEFLHFCVQISQKLAISRVFPVYQQW